MMWMFGLTAAVVAVDGYIKHYMEKYGKKANRFYGTVSIRYCQNKGAVYSIGKDRPEFVKKASFAIAGGVAWKWFATMQKTKNVLQCAGYSLLLGGSISNLWDRWNRKYVVDYLHVNVKYLKKIIFNISDVCIVFGGILIALSEMFGKKK